MATALSIHPSTAYFTATIINLTNSRRLSPPTLNSGWDASRFEAHSLSKMLQPREGHWCQGRENHVPEVTYRIAISN